MGACFGIGMIAGPILGGFVGQIAPNMPFILASILNFIAFIITFCFFPETKTQNTFVSQDSCSPQNKTSSYYLITKGIFTLLFVFFVIQLIGQIPATTWVLFVEDRFKWNSTMVGLSIAGFGILHSVFQAFITGNISKKLGEKITIIIGIISDSAGFFLLAITINSWVMIPIMFLLAGGGISLPALQSIISTHASSDNQGKLQGLLVGLTNLAGVIGPILFSFLYSTSIQTWNGLVWIVGVVLYMLLLVLLTARFFINKNQLKS